MLAQCIRTVSDITMDESITPAEPLQASNKRYSLNSLHLFCAAVWQSSEQCLSPEFKHCVFIQLL